MPMRGAAMYASAWLVRMPAGSQTDYCTPWLLLGSTRSWVPITGGSRGPS